MTGHAHELAEPAQTRQSGGWLQWAMLWWRFPVCGGHVVRIGDRAIVGLLTPDNQLRGGLLTAQIYRHAA